MTGAFALRAVGRFVRPLLCAVIVAWLCPSCLAYPALSKARVAGPLHVVFPDTKDAGLFYYPPGSLKIAGDAAGDGSPDLKFLQMVYMGSVATRDPDRFVAHSVLSFRVKMIVPTAEQLRAALATLPAGAKLRPLPIAQMDTRLVWTPLEGDAAVPPAAPAEGTTVEGGALESGDPAMDSSAGSYWTERMFTVHPGSYSSQALWEAFQHGRVMMSLAYTFYTPAIDDRAPIFSGTGEVVRAVEAATGTDKPQEDKPKPVAIVSDALPILVDASRYPTHFRRIDINQGVPPGYAALEIRCYDFANELRSDLALKIVDVRAQGVAGAPVTGSISFRASSPDISAGWIRFPFAIRFDQPFSYRIVEVWADGNRNDGPWTAGEWSRMLDVTSHPATVPNPPVNKEQPQ